MTGSRFDSTSLSQWEGGPEHVLRNIEDPMTQDCITLCHLQVYLSIFIPQRSRIHETGKYKCGAKLALKNINLSLIEIYRKNIFGTQYTSPGALELHESMI